MAAASTAVRGLSTEELETIRDGLAAGRRPKVVFTEAAGQIAGQTGQVVRLTDPALSDEWVVVRFGKDELPFSPTDLSIPPRTAPARRSAPAVREQSEPQLTRPSAPTPREPMPAEEQPMSARSASPASPVAKADAPAAAAGKPDAARRSDTGRPEAAAPRKTGRQGKPKGPAGLTVTLAYADGEWTVAAQHGSKVVAKPYVIRPAEALRMVGLLDVPAVQEAVEQIVAAERAEAEQQAQKLRAELAEVEARLAELRDVG